MEFSGRHNARPLDTKEQMAAMVQGSVGKRLEYKDLVEWENQVAFNSNEAIRNLVTQYVNNARCLAGLRNSIHDIGRQLDALHQMVTEYTRTIEVGEKDLILQNGNIIISQDVIGRLVEYLNNLNEMTKEKERMGGCLRQVGLAEIIRDS